jgi:glycerol uptake facilitator-like aquaporin
VKKKGNIIDSYFAYPILFDFALVVVIWICSKYLTFFDFKLIDRVNQIYIFPYIISADVSLAGFILASLTIIVTFKSNLKSRGIEDANNALELIFSSKHYENIVKVFKKSLIEFILCMVFIFVVWASADNFSIRTINRVNTTGIIITTLAIFRCLYILFVILDLSQHKRD